MPRLLTTLAASSIAWMLWAIPLSADPSDFAVFHAHNAYSSVLLQQGRVELDSDFNEETGIQQGQSFGIFAFEFDPAAIHPVVGAGIVGGLAVGAAPDGTLGGDQGISVVVTPGLAINAFGVLIAYGPFQGDVPADVFRVIVQCPNVPCFSAGNLPDLDPHGGTFFLGIIAAPGVEFTAVTLEADIPRDQSGQPDGSVPAWQIASLTMSPVPEPSTWILLTACLGYVAARRRVA